MFTDANELILHSVKVSCLWHNIIRCSLTYLAKHGSRETR